jgi:hypothetical protein
MSQNCKSSFHPRFTNPALVSHFTSIPVQRETNGISDPVTYDRPSENVKRSPAKIHALVSRETAFVSPHFRFYFRAALQNVTAPCTGGRPVGTPDAKLFGS